jgi:diguanylate cyclase (GGDEF)-like protein
MKRTDPMGRVSTSKACSEGAPPRKEIEPVSAALDVATTELAALYSAFDKFENGIIILDKDLRLHYANPSLHAMFKSPRWIIEGKPLYTEMLDFARQSGAYAISPEEVEGHIARRLAWTTSGNPTPVDQHLSSGRVIRCNCAILSGGGRMLIYSDVTDIVRQAEELERLATTDGMTGIYNRRHFMTLADCEWARSRRHQRPLSCLMIDIDFFKLINDGFGHEVGDQMIIHFVKLAREYKRGSDVLARIGGEEFALLLPETDLPAAHVVAERLRREFAASPLVETPGRIPATVSIGGAVSDDATIGFSDLMKSADTALYDAKRGGRNCVVFDTPARNTLPRAPYVPLVSVGG